MGREALGNRGSALGFMQRHQLWRQHVVRPALHLILALEDRVQPPQPGLANVGQRVHLSYPQQRLSLFMRRVLILSPCMREQGLNSPL